MRAGQVSGHGWQVSGGHTPPYKGVSAGSVRPECPGRWTYDELQRNAVLKACLICGHWFFFTNHAAEVCASCR